MRLIVSKKNIYFSFFFFLISTTLCFGNTVSKIANNDYNDASQSFISEKENYCTFNPVTYSSFKGYKGDGSFVEGPAHVGDWTGYIIGIVPAIALSEPFRLIPILSDEGDGIGMYTLYTTTKTFGCLFGGPSFVLKAIFWDAPIWVYTSINGGHSSSTSRVKPAVKAKTVKDTTYKIYGRRQENVRKHQITSISAKPSMLKKQQALEEQSNNEGGEVFAKPALTETFSSEKIITKDDETSWTTSPELPNWVKKEIEKDKEQ